MFGFDVESTTFSCPPDDTSVVSDVGSEVVSSPCLQPNVISKLANNKVLMEFFIMYNV